MELAYILVVDPKSADGLRASENYRFAGKPLTFKHSGAASSRNS